MEGYIILQQFFWVCLKQSFLELNSLKINLLKCCSLLVYLKRHVPVPDLTNRQDWTYQSLQMKNTNWKWPYLCVWVCVCIMSQYYIHMSYYSLDFENQMHHDINIILWNLRMVLRFLQLYLIMVLIFTWCYRKQFY